MPQEKIEYQLWLSSAAVSARAQGRGDFSVQVTEPGLGMETEGWLRIGEPLTLDETSLPSREDCIRAALARLAEAENRIKEELTSKLALIEQSRQKMLAIGMEGARE